MLPARIGRDWMATLRWVHEPRASATVWGPELRTRSDQDARRLRGFFDEASRQLPPGKRGIAVLHMMLDDRRAISPELARVALGKVSSTSIASVLACTSDRSGIYMARVA